MRRLNLRAPRIAGLLALALGAVAFLALSGVAAAKDHGGSDHGHHGRHHHHHHFREMSEAGTISSFDATTGKLTIALPDGETVTGMVSEETRIRCEGEDRRFDRRDHGGSGNEPGDDNGGRGNEPGDDNGGQNEPGDDNGGEAGEASCTVVSLVPGAVVGEAELRLEGGVATFTEVDLGIDS
jgi:hypothetical protein